MKWERKKLLDCCLSISDGDHQPPPKTNSGIPFITISNFTSNNQINFDSTMYVPKNYYDNIDVKRKAVKGDILYSVVGSYGTPVLIKNNNPFVFQRHIAILRPNELVDNRFLYYSMLSKDFYNRADAIAIGAAQKTITLTALRNMEISLPNIEVQTCIADILSGYDDLIENNQKQIKLLEEAAMLLYKEWFVKLRFPNHENTKIVDGVPDGWLMQTINSVCTRINAGGTPSRTKNSYWDDGSIKWFKTKELLDSWLLDCEEKITLEGLKESSAKLFPANSILMAIYASPTLGRLGILSEEACSNQAALCMVADENIISWQWLYHKLLETRGRFNSIARGAGQQNISGEVVKNELILVPKKEIIDEFTRFVAPLFELQKSLKCQVNSLLVIRDRLLPKLMSGEIEV